MSPFGLTLFSLLFFSAMKDSQALLFEQPPPLLEYHNGTLLRGNFSLSLVWYGSFSLYQRAIIVDFLSSLSGSPSVAAWWATTEAYGGATAAFSVKSQFTIRRNTTRVLSEKHIHRLAAYGARKGEISIVLTAEEVTVEGFCMSRCGTHRWRKNARGVRLPFVWVGNSAGQCPGFCAWPFHRPVYGPQTPPLVAPNGDVGADGMVVNLAALLAGTVTNPFNGGFFQGATEAGSVCAGVFGPGAYPGYPGRVGVDKVTGCSYNAVGVAGRKFLLPAMWDPRRSLCATAAVV